MAAGEGQQIAAHISKRLRTLRKKYNRITGFEESVSQGKTLNKDQEEIVRSKPEVAAVIRELENLRLVLPPLASAAVSKGIILAVQQKEVADEKEVMAKTLTETTDCKISVDLDDGEISKDDTCSACSGSSQGVNVTPSPTSEKVQEEKVEEKKVEEEDEMPWTEVTRRRRRAPQGPPQGAPPHGAPQGRGRGRQGPPGRKTYYNRQTKRPASN